MDIRVRGYGADTGNMSVQTESLQREIDMCSEAGGGCVIFESGVFVTGTLHIKDNVTLCIEKNATLLGSINIEDYPDNESCFVDAVGHKRGKTLFYAYENENIGITGEGIIDGRGGNFPPDHPQHLIRPFLIRIVKSKKVIIEAVKLQDAAAWCLHILDSSNVRVENIAIQNRCNSNNDGIDVDGSDNVVIKGCNVDSGDDAICLKATSNRACRNIKIMDCKVTSDWAAFKIGTESVGDFENIEVSNCYFYDVKGCGIKIVPVDGANVKKVTIKNIKMMNCTGPIFISTGERLKSYFEVKRNTPGIIENLIICGIQADVVSAKGGIYQGGPWGNSKGSIVISGLKEQPLRDITISNCNFSMPGGIENYETKEVPEMGVQYPEFHLFDVLPSCAFYIRHAEDVTLEKVAIYLKQPDCRPVFVTHDVVNVKTRGMRLNEE